MKIRNSLDFSVSDDNFLSLVEEANLLIEPPEDMTISEFAEKHIVIPEGNAKPGPYKNSRAPHLVEIMDMITDPDCRHVVACMSAQGGKTQVLLNTQAYYVYQEPKYQMFMQPTKDDVDKYTETKLDPAIKANDILSSRIAKKRSLEGKNTKYLKTYPGGAIVCAWSNSTNSQRGISAPVILKDEGDEYPMTSQGHAGNLLAKRNTTFGDEAIEVDTCTPTKDDGYIWQLLLSTDFRERWVPCKHCGEMFVFDFKYLKFDRNENGDIVGEPWYCCNVNGCVITEEDRDWMLQRGKWIAKNPFVGLAGFHSSVFISTFVTLKKIAMDYVKGLKSGDTVSFLNTSLALPVKAEYGEEVDWKKLYDRREDYPINIVPPKCLFLTCAVDVQKDRLELEIKAWQKDQQVWGVDYRIIEGDPHDRKDQCWNKLDEVLDETFDHSKYDVALKIRMLAIDAGYLTDDVCAWARRHKRTGRVLVLRGREKLERILNKPSDKEVNKKGKVVKRGVKIWRVGTNVAKDELFRRLELEAPLDGVEYPFGYFHFPSVYDDNYFKGLTAEVLEKTKTRGGKSKQSYEPIRDRNEPIDLSNYNRAAFIHCGGERFNSQQWEDMENRLKSASLVSREDEGEQSERSEKTLKAKEVVNPKKKKKRRDDHFGRLRR